MGDISTWNPVDNSNTTAPPDGWPEAMPPSAVNNSARAMMGAVRRWYDTVTTQIAGMLPLSGGTITGDLQVDGNLAVYGTSGIGLGPTQLQNIGNGLQVYNTSGGEVTSRGPLAGFVFGDRNQSSPGWQWFALNDAAYLQRGTASLAVIGSGGDLNVAGSIGTPGLLTAANIHTTGGVAADGAVTAAGTISAAQLTSTGNINAAGTVTGTSFIGNVSVPANGPVTTGGTVTAGQVTSTGNINASGDINASVNVIGASLRASSDVWVGSHPALSGTTAGRLDILTPSGDLALILYGNPTWQNSYFNNTHQFGNSGRDFTYVTFGIAGTFNQSGTWGTLSDASLKDDIAPYERGLEAILALSPVSFRYRDGTPFADPERTVRYGLVAQDVAGVIPEMVGETTLETGGAVATMFPGHLVFVLTTAVKELAAQNAALAARITALEAR